MMQPTIYIYRVEIYTPSLLMSGSLEVAPYRRMSDILNDSMSPYLVLKDAIISPISHPEQVQPVSHMFIDRQQIPIMTALREPAPPKDYTAPSTAGRFEVQQMMFFTDSFVIRGNYYKRPDMTLQKSIENIVGMFVPVRSVNIFPISGGARIVREFACLGRAYIQALYPSSASDDVRLPGEETSPW